MWVDRVQVPVQRLAPAFDGFRIAQISDLHIGEALDEAFLERVVAQVNALMNVRNDKGVLHRGAGGVLGGGGEGTRACAWERRRGVASRPLRASSSTYRRRRPEETVLHEAVREGLAGFLAETAAHEGGLPRFMEKELRRYLECGVLAFGFTRVLCDSCKDELLVAFSCKQRGVCPSCTARRATDTAVRLVEEVLPQAPYR
jgi:hypothetical protein